MPERLTATIWFQPSIDTLRKLRFGWLMPALLMSTSTRPWRFAISAAAFATSCWSETSSAMLSPLPAALICFSLADKVSRLLPEMITCAPALASSIPPAKPMPEPPPVIQTTLPFGILLRTEQVLALLVGHLRAPPVGEHLHRALHRGALEDGVAPLLERRKVVDVHALALGRAQPRHGRHVGDGVLVARQVLAFPQSPIHDAVETIRFVLVAVHGVLDLLRRVAEEVVRLAEHRADVAHLEHGPLHHLPALAQVLRQELAGLRGEVEEHRTRFGERERLAVGAVGIDHRRHLVVGRDLEEVGLELVAHADVDRVHVVLEAGLLQHDVDLVAVRGGPGIELNHRRLSPGFQRSCRASLACAGRSRSRRSRERRAASRPGSRRNA